MTTTIPLFRYYPTLADKLPYVTLGEFPTPIHKLNNLSDITDVTHLYIKRDDLSGCIYGGNKVRKLEFVLGDTLFKGKKEVLTFGCVGSNHALATALYASQIGLKCISILLPQPNAHYVRNNLLMHKKLGTELISLSAAKLGSPINIPLMHWLIIVSYLKHKLITGKFPMTIPIGGSSPLGTIGYINAAFELKEQIMRGEIPEPDFIYVAAGTCGTAAGLITGLKAAQLKTKVIAVRVTGASMVNTKVFLKLIHRVVSLLRSKDTSFPELEFNDDDINICHDFFGQQYALFTEEGINALNYMKEYEGIKLEGTYTAKAFAALMYDSRKGNLKNKNVLFWNTVNSRDYYNMVSSIDYHGLPKSLYKYFQEEVQILDR